MKPDTNATLRRELPDETKPPENLEQTLGKFIEYVIMRGYTRQTQHGYRRYGRDFVAWCETRGFRCVAELPSTVLLDYQQVLATARRKDGVPLCIRSQLAKLVPTRAFLRWLAREMPALQQALDGSELPKAPRTLPRALLSPREMGLLLKQPNIHTKVGLRDRAILELFYGVGLRRSELVELRLEDVDQDRMTLMIRQGKGGRDRFVPLGEQALTWLIRYLQDSRPALLGVRPDFGVLFIGRKGKALHPSWLSTLVNGYLRRIRPGRPGACHLLRHSMATAMLENRADIRYIQAILGHAQLSSTQIYTHVAMRQLRRVYEATHPAGARQGGRERTRRARHPLQRQLQGILEDLPLNASFDDLVVALSDPLRRTHIDRHDSLSLPAP